MDDGAIPQGKRSRLGRLLGLSARVGGALVRREPSTETARLVLDTLGDLRGLALKLGQAAVPALDPRGGEVGRLLGGLYTGARSMSWPRIAARLEEELGGPLHHHFASIEPVPFAAASLGQVHRAVLPGGEVVAVKVQYPGVGDALDDDLGAAGAAVRIAGLGTDLFDGRRYYELLAAQLRGELDYLQERLQLERFRAEFAPFPSLVVPRTFPALCTEKVLVMELLEGPTLHDWAHGSASAAKRLEVGLQLTRAIYGPFLRTGVVHGDPHPGNFVLLGDGRLGVLDFGSTRQVGPAFHRCYREVFGAVLRGEAIDWVDALEGGGFTVALPKPRAQSLLGELLAVAARPLRGPFDFGSNRVVDELVAFGRKRATDLVRFRPPPEGLIFLRAVLGLVHALQLTRSAGDFRPVFAEILDLPPDRAAG
ncbi:ABC1 kinase family protein [Vulgatibacter sp.]|uniref:ABC1 kinase family protein n=1 Tax=Vulgatibacter sp. TaxID=1971226 RepID=UPI00356474DB